jgi:hypothetical protein
VVRKENTEAVKAIVSDFSTTTKTISDTFSETTTTLLRQSRQEAVAREQQAAEREQSLHALLKDHHQRA